MECEYNEQLVMNNWLKKIVKKDNADTNVTFTYLPGLCLCAMLRNLDRKALENLKELLQVLYDVDLVKQLVRMWRLELN